MPKKPATPKPAEPLSKEREKRIAMLTRLLILCGPPPAEPAPLPVKREERIAMLTRMYQLCNTNKL